MELGDAITVTKLNILNLGESCLMIGWQMDSFDVYLFNKENLWKGQFSPNRLRGFSKNLNLSEMEYFENVRKCLSQRKENYRYEVTNGCFYWKRKCNDSLVLEGYLPLELETSPKIMQPDLVKILTSLNNHLKVKVNVMRCKFEAIKLDYEQCLRDTEEFLNIKINVEKTLCENFVNTLQLNDSVGSLPCAQNFETLVQSGKYDI